MNQLLRDLAVIVVFSFGAVASVAGWSAEPQPIAGGEFEASGVVHVPGTDGVLFVDDAETRQIFWMQLSPEGKQTSEALPVPLPDVDVVDLEALTTDGTYFYAVGSQSKESGFGGDGLVRFTFDPTTRTACRLESIRGLKRFLSQHVVELHGVEKRIGDDVLNIEGLAWDARQARLLLALRAPVTDGHALVVPLKLRDARGTFALENLRVDGRALRIATNGAGLRSIEFDPRRQRFVMITGAELDPETMDFRVLEWDGRDRAPVEELRRYSRTLKPEGIARARIAGRDATVIVFDTGLYQVLP